MNTVRTLQETKERLELELLQLNERIAKASSEDIPKMLTINRPSSNTPRKRAFTGTAFFRSDRKA